MSFNALVARNLAKEEGNLRLLIVSQDKMHRSLVTGIRNPGLFSFRGVPTLLSYNGMLLNVSSPPSHMTLVVLDTQQESSR